MEVTLAPGRRRGRGVARRGSRAARRGAAPRTPDADAAAAKASVRYLSGAQNGDGGWGGAPGQSRRSCTPAGRRSGSPRPGATRATSAAPPRSTSRAAGRGELNDLGELSRTILVFAAAGLSPRDVGGRDLVAELLRKRKANGSFAGRVNTTAFAALALKAGGRRPRARAAAPARWIARPGERDGGFNFAGRGGPSGIDDTGAAVQGLVAAGRSGTRTVAPRRALPRPPPERRRRLPARAGRRLERAVDRVGGPGPARRRPRPGEGPPALARPAGLPALAHVLLRRGPLLADQPPDARVGHRPGRDGARAQAAAAEAGRPRPPRRPLRPRRPPRPRRAAAPAGRARRRAGQRARPADGAGAARRPPRSRRSAGACRRCRRPRGYRAAGARRRATRGLAASLP